MKAIDFNKANVLWKRIVELNTEINRLAEYANTIATGNSDQKIFFKLSANEEAMVQDNRYPFEPGIGMGTFERMFGLGSLIHPELNDNKKNIKKSSVMEGQIPDVVAIQMCGLLLSHYKAERNKIVFELREMGVQV